MTSVSSGAGLSSFLPTGYNQFTRPQGFKLTREASGPPDALGTRVVRPRNSPGCDSVIDVTLRPATAADSEFAYQTKKAAFRQYVEKVCGWDEDVQRRLHERRFASQDFQVIQVSGIDVGVLAIARTPDCVKVNQMFILPEYQSRGIGAVCMKRIIEDASASKLPVRLRVLKVNCRAIAFYKRLGFRAVGEPDTHVLMEIGPT